MNSTAPRRRTPAPRRMISVQALCDILDLFPDEIEAADPVVDIDSPSIASLLQERLDASPDDAWGFYTREARIPISYSLYRTLTAAPLETAQGGRVVTVAAFARAVRLSTGTVRNRISDRTLPAHEGWIDLDHPKVSAWLRARSRSPDVIWDTVNIFDLEKKEELT